MEIESFVKSKINRLGRAFIIICALTFGFFLTYIYPAADWHFIVGFAFILAGGLGTIISLFLVFKHPDN